MDAKHWHNRWENNEIGFHEGDVNRYLDQYFTNLSLQPGDTVFVPLCGKTHDIHFLLASGMKVVGAELSEIAIKQLFQELNLTPEITNHGTLTCYQGANLTVWVGDIFTLTPEQLGTVNAVYDRAALVALPLSMRVRYTQHILQLANKAQQLVVVFEYQQSEFSGPPFNVTANELHQHYDAYYQLALLCREPLEGGLKGKIPAMNAAWLLS
ncbi:thiopurine S-methyltransferase [Pseudoalteromonas lipolytica]|uniref:thiopurine S-methyltransferase n=1 Tax=Pseudoalteromonas lipolytica TaxID=570156 RepID=UPI00241CAA0C|nr:thiopurine S-methyltransferase [Pseudoalteromonas lipolytica]|tara:strand:+ start:11162 stop:11794 length:633 start_codon:yes stop_codon:yes gene_type:complete